MGSVCWAGHDGETFHAGMRVGLERVDSCEALNKLEREIMSANCNKGIVKIPISTLLAALQQIRRSMEAQP